VKKRKQHIILIATSLKDTIKEFEQHPPPIAGFKIFRLQYIIHLILSHRQKKRPGSYSLLNMQYMSNVVPQANQYLNLLHKQRIIQWKNYSAGRNSRLYRLRKVNPTEFRTITDQALIRRIENSRLSKHNSCKYKHLNRSIKKIEIDVKGALRTIRRHYNSDVFDNNPEAESRRTYSQAAVARIAAQDFYISVNTTNYRLDSNLTNLPSELIKHITIDGYRLIEMDISNSQPFFVAALFDPTPGIQSVTTRYLGKKFATSIISLQLLQYEGVKLYKHLVTSGTFYKYMAEKFKENNISFRDKKDLKQQIFGVFFGCKYAHKYRPAAKVFKQCFPNIHKLFTMIKKDEHNRLAILLQRIESYVMLDRVVKNIHDKLPALDILTKHDSILPVHLYVNRECERARRIMIRTIHRITGMYPQGRIRKYVRV